MPSSSISPYMCSDSGPSSKTPESGDGIEANGITGRDSARARPRLLPAR